MIRTQLFDLFLKFWTGEEFNVIYADVIYPINDIPRAIVRIPLGRIMVSIPEVTHLPPSEGYQLLNNFSHFRFNICSLYVVLKYPTTDDEKQLPQPHGAPEGIYHLFTGFISDIGTLVSSTETPYIELNLAHFLEFLRASSILNASTHPTNPTAYAFDPTLSFGGAGTPFNLSASASLYSTLERALAGVDPYYLDLWRHVIYPILMHLSTISVTNSRMLWNYLEGEVSGNQNDDYERSGRRGDTENDSAHRFIGKLTKAVLNSFDQLRTWIPLGALPPNVVQSMVDVLIENIFRSEAFEQNVTSTFWDKLLEIANAFMLAVVPFPDRYAVRPFCLGLAHAYSPYLIPAPGETAELFGGFAQIPDHAFVTFAPQSIINLAIGRSEPTFNVRCVCALSDFDTLAGSQLNNGVMDSYDEIVGAYCSIRTRTGQILFVPSPPYLKPCLYENVVTETLNEEGPQPATTSSAEGSSGGGSGGSSGGNGDSSGGEGGGSPTTTSPSVPEKTTIPSARRPERISEASRRDRQIDVYRLINPLDRYAQYAFILQQIGRRTMRLVCPFRADVEPGATVKIFTYKADFLPDIPVPVIFGTVREVRYVFDINTSPHSIYDIIGWRSKFESMHPDFSVPLHPLYLTLPFYLLTGQVRWHLPWMPLQ